MANVSIDTSELSAAAANMIEAAAKVEVGGDEFAAWAEETAEIMREEVPVDTEQTKDSITVRRTSKGWKIGPTNRDKKGRPIGVFIYYGTRGNPGNKFLDRTADKARENAPSVDVDGLL